MARGPGFGALGKNFIIVGNAQHRIFGLRFGYLIRATTSFFCALTPVPRVVKEGPSCPLQPIRKDLVIRFRRQRLAREAIMAAKEISVKKYVVRLSGEERERLETLLRKGKSPARRVLKARILLKADVSE